MKATEIQLGNYLSYNGQIIKVSSITKKKVGYHIKENECRMHYARLCECNPISITTEILEKNGFIKDAQEDEKSVADVYHLLIPTNFESKSFTIQVSLYREPICGVSTLVKCWGWLPPYNAGMNDIHLCSANYVHQLQHALRLCRIEKEIEL